MKNRYLLEIFTRNFKHRVLDWMRLISPVSVVLIVGKPANFPLQRFKSLREIEGNKYKIKMQVKKQRVEKQISTILMFIKPSGEILFYLFQASVMLSYLENSREHFSTFYLIYLLIYLSTLKVVIYLHPVRSRIFQIMRFVQPIKWKARFQIDRWLRIQLSLKDYLC